MSSKLVLTFKGIIVNDESDYTLDDMKEALGLNNDKSLVNFLLRLLKEEVEAANFDTMTYEKSIISNIYEYLSAFIIEGRQCDIESVSLRLGTIKMIVNKKISNINSCIRKDNGEIANPLFEKDFWWCVRDLNNEILDLISISEKYEGERGYYYLLSDMVYNIQNLYLLQEVSEKFPRLLLERNNEGEFFFFELLEHYVDLIKNPVVSIAEIIYYDAVVGMFLSNDKLKINKKYKDLISVAINQVNHGKGFDKDTRNQRLIFLNHLRKKFMGEKMYVANEKELGNKYMFSKLDTVDGLKEFKEQLNDANNVYHDFTDKKVITIDPVGASELDDGISLEKLKNGNYLLGVYITDVSNYVAINSDDDIKALHRGATLYLSNGLFIPMLPKTLSLNHCSFLPDNVRKAIVCFYEIETDGHIKQHFFTKGLIKTRANLRFSYTDVNEMFKHGSFDSLMERVFHQLQIFSGVGLLKNISDEAAVKAGKVEAHSIIGKYMVLTNYIAAMDAKKGGLPFLFRTHHTVESDNIIDDNPNLAKLVNGLDNGSHNCVARNIISNSFSKAYYSTEALPHEGLGLPVYSHITSPLRRYADLANQRLIKLFFIDKLKEEKMIYQIENILKNIAEDLNDNQFVINQYANDYAHILKR